MPVTAKLSRQFYEQFGDAVVDELVNLLNTVDANSRSDLRELNELNFARFEAKLEQRIAESEGRLRTELHALKADLTKWMFLFVTGGTLANFLFK